MVARIPDFISAILFLFVGGLAMVIIRWDFAVKSANAQMASETYNQMSAMLQQLLYKEASQEQIAVLQQIKVSIANGTKINVDDCRLSAIMGQVKG